MIHMKAKIFNLLVLVAVLTGFSACNNDPCEDKVCLNGGNCVEGICNCPTGFTGPSCETIVCFNGGVASQGFCQCPTGFTGTNCQTARQPISITVSRIELLAYPATDNGAGWDLTSGPDIFLGLSRGGSSVWQSNQQADDASPGQTYIYTPTPALVITNLAASQTFDIWDYDPTDSDDYMAGIVFTPNSVITNFPNQIVLETSAARLRLTVTYNF